MTVGQDIVTDLDGSQERKLEIQLKQNSLLEHHVPAFFPSVVFSMGAECPEQDWEKGS